MPNANRQTPQSYHDKKRCNPDEWPRHREERWEDCPQCLRELRVCKGKKRHETVEDAWEACLALNERERYASGVIPYWCRYCEAYHKKTARKSAEKRRVAKQRSKFLVAEYLSEHATSAGGRRRVLP